MFWVGWAWFGVRLVVGDGKGCGRVEGDDDDDDDDDDGDDDEVYHAYDDGDNDNRHQFYDVDDHDVDDDDM